MDSNKEKIEDLASLFLPDLLHPSTVNSSPSTSTSPRATKSDDYDMGSIFLKDSKLNNPNTGLPSSFQEFLSNNNFINRSNDIEEERPQQQQQQQPQQYSHHYSGYMPFEMNPSASQHVLNYNPGMQQMFQQPNIASQQNFLSSSIPGQQQQQSQMTSNFPRTNSYYGKYPGDYDEWFASTNSSITNLNGLYQQQLLQSQMLQQPQPMPQPQRGEIKDTQIDSKSGSSTPKRKKTKSRKRDIKNLEVQIDYKPSKLKRLLDLKQSGATSSNDYKIIDKNNNEVTIDLNGFLNGRFLTNDIDNNNYIFMQNELQRGEDGFAKAAVNKKENPKVVSCYRRNYIQISVNMNIRGFKDDSKLLKLQTSEYGYTTTRVIKYFKIEVSAAADILNSKGVPIIIKNENKDIEREKEKEARRISLQSNYEYKADTVSPTYINTSEHVIILNDEPISNGCIDKYFVVKKLQFKNATPNNGNLNFQNYYHLKAKLSCIVADIYYDDYDIDMANDGGGGSNNNEILLAELVSEPIIVRGRNPSFYAERNDILIKGRSASSKSSFKIAAQSSELKLTASVEADEDEDEEFIVEHEDEQEEEDDHHNHSGGDQEDQIQANNHNGTGESPISSGDDDNTQMAPLSYSTNQSALDVKSVDKYKYYPINSVYYLPPINVVYFPHRAHQSQKDDQEQTSIVQENRKSSNVYFK
ncbi:conserved hypothetical protein [Candida dubliniensis CD36]|uniref:NDT80 domain-containing protein n=1 Tax=Candida dubliniensis (strain CD36 / ATCC MYA-646 / CBS 7987 / NCPF 3949 / NRRL Y-17841) TaxID=573826 RepID=B9WKK9_CANDC|nr:conserved hypothetical protein [Candida dubliniensis CD36]CAX39557.1 conserved hypothetical protein [Candida dubliniensis CD36]